MTKSMTISHFMRECPIDGMLICNGPKLGDECAQLGPIKDGTKVAFINSAYQRIIIPPQDAVIIAMDRDEDFQFEVSAYSPYDLHEFSAKRGHWMTGGDNPTELISNGFSMYTGIHYLTTLGCKCILGLGVNLCPWPEGSYNAGGRKWNAENEHVVTQIRKLWNLEVCPNLKELGVKFHSDALSTLTS